MSVGVFVLGMHRSGTSATARLVNLLGVPTAAEHDLPKPTSDNPKGYWESSSLVAFNTRVLTAVGSETGCPLALELGWERDPRLSELRRQARQAFAQVFPTAPWVWKDPRNCLTFAFWTSVLDVQPAVVLVHRNPLEIASSLQARNGEDKVYALALWERYVRQTLGALAGLPVLVTRYETLLAEPLHSCERLRAFLVGVGVETVGCDDEAVSDFIDARLRHAVYTQADLEADPGVSDAQNALHRSLLGLEGIHEHFSAPRLPAETWTTDPLLAERRRTVKARHELRRLDTLRQLSTVGIGKLARGARLLQRLRRVRARSA
jgi:hypothetical protein